MNKNYKAYLGSRNARVGITVLLIIVIIYFVIRPIALNTYTKYIQTAKYSEDISRMNENLEALREIRQINQDFEAQIALLDKVIPEEANEKDFLRDFAALCVRNQINLVSTSFTHLSDAVTFKIELDGRYENVPTLLNDVNNMLRLTSIEAVSVQALDTASQGGVVKAEITGRIFKKAK